MRRRKRDLPTVEPAGDNVLPIRPHASTEPPRLDVVFLGTAAASGIAHQATSSMLLRYGDERVLVDCGGRSLTQMRRAGIDPASITAIVITHWHSDHVAGLATLLKAAAQRKDRSAPLRIYAPDPPRGVRTTLGLANRMLAIELVPIAAGTEIPLRGGRLTAIGTDHVVPSLGYAFSEDAENGRLVVFSGDTRPNLAIIAAARGADLLIHEATFVSARKEWAQKIGHCTAAQTAEIGRAAGVGALALTHISARDDRPTVLREAQTIFPGAVLPDDLEVLEVPARAQPSLPHPASRPRHGWSKVIHYVIPARHHPEADGLAS